MIGLIFYLRWLALALLIVGAYILVFHSRKRLEHSYGSYFNPVLHAVRWPLGVVFSRYFRTRWHESFLTCLFSLLAKMATADGAITQDELLTLDQIVRQQLTLDDVEMGRLYEILRQPKSSQHSFEDYAHGYYLMFRRHRLMLENMIEILLAVAYADARYSHEEQRLMRVATQIFGISQPEFDRIRARHRRNKIFEETKTESSSKNSGTKEKGEARTESSSGSRSGHSRQEEHRKSPPRESPSRGRLGDYQILGCSPQAPVAEVKRQYRKLVLKYHPDRLSHWETPEELRKLSVERFRSIQEAYERIRRDKGF